MPHDDSRPSPDPSLRSLIRSKVRKLVARAPFARQLREDLEQDLWLAVHQRTQAAGLRPEECLASLSTLLDNRLVDFLRRAHAGKRDYRRLRSLHVLVQEGDGALIELGQTLHEQAHRSRLGREARSDQEAVELAKDVADVLRQLPPELRELAERLRSKSPSEVARDTGVARSTLQWRMGKLRRIFEQAGLQKHLDRRRQFPPAPRR